LPGSFESKPTGVNPWAFLLALVWTERHRDYAAHCTDEKG